MSEVRVVRPGDPVTVTRGAGDEYRYLATGANTDGTYFLMEALVPPGAGPPPHTETREEEGFYILEGSLTFWPDGEETRVGPGTFINVPKEVDDFSELCQEMCGSEAKHDGHQCHDVLELVQSSPFRFACRT